MTEENKKELKEKEPKVNKLPDHIDEYFTKSEGSPDAIKSRELFSADNLNIDLKTDVNFEEISIISTLKFNDKFLVSKGLKPIFQEYYNDYLRLKVSKDRLSRGEFVKINQANNSEDTINTLSNLSNITGVRK